MSTDNITAFLSKLSTNPDLADKLALATAEAYARIAQEEGLPFTAEEFLAEQGNALSDASLSEVAGGQGSPDVWISQPNRQTRTPSS